VSGKERGMSSYRIDFVEAQAPRLTKKSPQNQPLAMYDGAFTDS